jgi:hypothetical protein
MDRPGKESSLQTTGPNLKTTKNETPSETPGHLFLPMPDMSEEALLPRVPQSARSGVPQVQERNAVAEPVVAVPSNYQPPGRMKTLLDITREHIERNASLANQPEQLISEAHRADERMNARFQADPSLLTFVEHYAGALLNVLKILPPEIHPLIAKSLLAQVIAEWEEINLDFEDQLKTMA